MEQTEGFDLAAPLLGESDEALFARVWKRVQGDAGAAEGAPPGFPIKSARDGDGGASGMRLTQAPTGDGDSIYKIREAIDNALADWQNYRKLAGMAPPGAAVELAQIAADELRHAGRLAAALFLLTGVRYFPREGAVARRFASRWEGLRWQFERELDGRETCLAIAQSMENPVFQELFLEVAEEDWLHARRIRALIEREMHTLPPD